MYTLLTYLIVESFKWIAIVKMTIYGYVDHAVRYRIGDIQVIVHCNYTCILHQYLSFDQVNSLFPHH